MATARNPFADDADQPPPRAERRRRPWWRWNIVTLALALFVVVWARHFTGFGYVTTWTTVITIFALWGLGPALVVPTFATSLPRAPGDPPAHPHASSGWWRRNGVLAVLRAVMLLLIMLSLMQLAQWMYWSVTYTGMRGRSGLLFGWGQNPILALFASTMLFLLTEIALRLDRGDPDPR